MWPDATRKIAESVAAQGCLRRYYGWVWPDVTRQIAESMLLRGTQVDVMNGYGLVQPNRYCGIYCRLEVPKGMLWMGEAWYNQADTVESIITRGQQGLVDCGIYTAQPFHCRSNRAFQMLQRLLHICHTRSNEI